VEIRIAHSDQANLPITWGFWKPVILLPKAAKTWPASRLSAALLHELGHVRRRDHLTQTVAFIVCTFHWYNPLFWRAARQMEEDADIAADDCAILAGIRPSTYATELLHLASQVRVRGRTSSLIETSMVKAFSLEHRIQSIINPHSSRGRMGFWRVAAVKTWIGLFFFLTGVSAGVFDHKPSEPTCVPTIAP
jgi:beta-lactamase regulating signal transducer with metallopeptidase domain